MIHSKLDGVSLAVAGLKLDLQPQMFFLFCLEDQLAAVNGSDFVVFELDLSQLPTLDLDKTVLLDEVNIMFFWLLNDLSLCWIGNKFVRYERKLYNRASLSILSFQFHGRSVFQLFNTHLSTGLFGFK